MLAYSQDTLDGCRGVYRAQVYNYTSSLNGQAVWAPTSDIKLTTTLGTQYTDVYLSRTDAFGAKLLAGTGSLAGTNARFAISEQTSDVRTLGFLGRAQFAWRDKVFLIAGGRTDRNSAFGPNYPRIVLSLPQQLLGAQRGGVLPEGRRDLVAAARAPRWLRGTESRVSRRRAVLPARRAIVAAGTDFPGFTVGGAGNPNLKPEKSTELEGGFDLGLLGDRVNLEYTHYNKITKDALVNVNLAPSLGSSPTRFLNLGQVRNYGDEALAAGRGRSIAET